MTALRQGICVAGIACLMAAAPRIAQADQGRITAYTEEVRRLAKSEGAAGIPAAFGTLRAWIAEAQDYQVAKDARGVALALARVEAQRLLIVALLAKVVTQRAATEAKAEAEEARVAAAQAHVATARREGVRRRLALSVEEAE